MKGITAKKLLNSIRPCETCWGKVISGTRHITLERAGIRQRKLFRIYRDSESDVTMLVKAYRYRLYPTKSQISQMEQTLEICRWVYNETLAMRRTHGSGNREVFLTTNQSAKFQSGRRSAPNSLRSILKSYRMFLCALTWHSKIFSGD